MLYRTYCPVLALGVLLARALPAQQPIVLTQGARVRITAPAAGIDRQDATYLAIEADSLILLERVRTHVFQGYSVSDTTRRTVPLAAVSRLDVRRRDQTMIVFSGAVGGLAGLAVGLTIGRSSSLCEGTLNDFMEKFYSCLLVYGVAIPAVGVSIGQLIGTSIATRWESVSLDRVRVGAVALPAGRLGLQATFAF